MSETHAQWWGFSKEHGWVVLDREIPCNVPGSRIGLLFLRCRDEKMFSLKWELWKLPAYQLAPNYVSTLKGEAAAEALAEYQALQARWPELQRSLRRQYQEIEDEEEAKRREEEKREKEAAASERKQRAAARALASVPDDS